MSRAIKLTLGTLSVASAIALAQSTIEPPRRTAPPAGSPATPTPAPAAAAAAPATGASAQELENKRNAARERFSRNRPGGGGGGGGNGGNPNRPIPYPGAAPAGLPAGAATLNPNPGIPGAAAAGGGDRNSLAQLVNADGTPVTAPPAGAPTSIPGVTKAAAGSPGSASAATSGQGQYMDIASLPLATVEDAIQEYENNTVPAVTVLRPNNLTGNVPLIVNPNAKMTRAEYVDFIKVALMVNGFSIHEYSPTLHAITFTGQATPLFDVTPPKEGHRVYVSPLDLPERDEFVNYFMQFENLPVTDAMTILGQPRHASGKFTPVPNAGGILITESVPVIKSLIAIKEKVDVPSGEIFNHFVQLKLADAEEIAQIIQQIQQQQNASKSGSSGGGSRVVTAPNAANQLSNQLNNGAPGNAQSASSADGSSVVVLADRRTGRILLSGKIKKDIVYMEKLIHDFDTPSEINNFVTYQLRYIRVSDFIDLASGALEARGFGTSGGSGGGASAGSSRQAGGNGAPADNRAGGNGQFGNNAARTSQTGTSGSRAGTSTASSRNGSTAGGAGSARSGGGSGGGSSSSSGSTLAAPTSVTVGKTLLISDPQSNSVIISGPPESRDQIRQLILEMDRRPLQVHIDCVIAELNLNDTMDFGLDLLRKVDSIKVGGNNVNVGGLFKNTGDTGGIIDPALLTTLAGFPTGGAGINSYFQVGDLVNGYIHASEGTGRIKVIQKPSISTANNQTAYISVGKEVPYPGQQQSNIVSTGTTSLNSSIEYKDVLLSLQVTPLINSKNEVTLDIEQNNNNLADNVIINNDKIPIISQQELQTTLTVPNGGIAIIGGLIKDSRSNTNSGAPFLARIPILKYLLGASNKTDSRQELMIFIQPRIMETTDEMISLNASEIGRTSIGNEAEKFARPPVDTSNVLLPTTNGSIPFDNAGIPTGQDAHPGFWKRVGDVFKRKTSVPQDPAYPR